MPIELQPHERTGLRDIIAELYDFADGGPRGRRVLMQMAGLDRFVSGMDLAGPPRTVAGQLIIKLEGWGVLPDQPTHHALGALLSYLLTLGELPPQDAAFIAKLIVKYSLVNVPPYIDRLRTDYNITEAAVAEPATTSAPYTAPTAPVGISPGPSFEVAIKDEEKIKALEQVIDDETNFLDIFLLFGAIYSAQAVCMIERPEGKPKGTGFLIGPDLVLTNQHVLRDEEYSKDAVARFGHMIDATGAELAGQVFPVKQYIKSSLEDKLDYALVRLVDRPLKDKMIADKEANLSLLDLVRLGKHRGYLPLAPRKIFEKERVNIVQHPNADPMKVVMTHNYVIEDMSETRVQYLADTMDGSSGSPVFNQKWEVVALHHSGAPWPPESASDTVRKLFRGVSKVNEGIPARAILKEIERFLPE